MPMSNETLAIFLAVSLDAFLICWVISHIQNRRLIERRLRNR